MKSKMVAIFAALMIALMVVGFAYAQWSKTLKISGNAETGYVDAEFQALESNDDGKGAVTATEDPKGCGTWTWTGTSWSWSGNRYDKDVGTCTVAGEGSDTLTITISNAYPGYSPSIAFNITNTGTIPVKVKSIKLNWYMIKKDGIGTQSFVYWDLTPCNTYNIDADSDGKDDFSIHLSKLNVGQVIDPDSSIPGDLCISILDGAKPSGDDKYTYSFEIEIVVTQWNI